VFLVLGLVAVLGVGALALVGGPGFEAQAAPSCEQQCAKEYRACVRYCSQPGVACFVSCETVLDICLSNCGVVQ